MTRGTSILIELYSSLLGGHLVRISRIFVWIIGSVLALAIPAAASPFTYITIDVPGAVQTSVSGISNAGVAVGFYEDSAGNEHGFERLVDGTLIYPIDDPKGVIGTSTLTYLYGINNAGTILGSGGVISADPFTLSGGVFTTYQIPGAFRTVLGDINDQGDFVGYYETNSVDHGFLQHGSDAPLTIDVPGSIYTVAFGINSPGDIVGGYRLADNVLHGFIRHPDGTFTTVDFPGAVSPGLFSINDSGVVIGCCSVDLSGKWFYGTPGNLVEFNIPGMDFSGLAAINNAGQFAGSYAGSDRVTHGFIGSYSDVPEPASGVLLVVGLAALPASRVKRTNDASPKQRG